MIGGGFAKDEREEDAMVLKTRSTERQYCIRRAILVWRKISSISPTSVISGLVSNPAALHELVVE